MGLLGSALGRGLAGAGSGASSIASKYIDEELAASRAKLLADLQHENMVRADQYNLSSERQELLRSNASAATISQAQAARDAELQGLKDPTYQGAVKSKKDTDATDQTARDVQRMQDMTPAEIEAHNAKTSGTLEADAARAAAITDAQAKATAKWRDRAGPDGVKLPPGVKAELDALDKRDEQLNAAITRAMADGGMWDPERNPSQKQLLAERAAVRLKRNQVIGPYLGGAGGADPLGLFGDKKPAGGQPAAPTTGEQGQRDVEAGKLMILNEYDGDIGKAREALGKLEAAAAQATGETKQMMQSEANRLRMGIEAMGAAKPSAPSLVDRATKKAGGMFTDEKGETQILQPLYDLNKWRRRLQDEANATQAPGGA